MDETTSKAKSKSRQRKPLEVNLTVVVRTGVEEENIFTLLDNRRVPMVGSVFEYRDRIRRFFVSSLLRVATSSPAVYREIAPGLAALLGRGRAAATQATRLATKRRE